LNKRIGAEESKLLNSGKIIGNLVDGFCPSVTLGKF
jgi:hypothetical protein